VYKESVASLFTVIPVIDISLVFLSMSSCLICDLYNSFTIINHPRDIIQEI